MIAQTARLPVVDAERIGRQAAVERPAVAARRSRSPTTHAGGTGTDGKIDVAFQTGRGQTVAERLGPLAGRPTVARSLLRAAGIDPSATPSELRPESWAAVTRALSARASSGAAR